MIVEDELVVKDEDRAVLGLVATATATTATTTILYTTTITTTTITTNPLPRLLLRLRLLS